MNIKMIVTDLDDTLLRSDKTVSGYTKDVLRRCRAAGIKTVIATGRGNPHAVAPTQLFDGIVSNNGANIFDGKTEIRRCIPFEKARPFLLACSERGLKVTSEYGPKHYSNFDVTKTWPDVRNFEIVDFSLHSIDSDKICIDAITPENAKFIRSQLSSDMHLKVARDGFGMVMHSLAVKSAGVSELATRWNIHKNEIVAFGDDVNDLDLLKYAGVAVAMDNALSEVKSAADYICSNCDDDGAAKWIEEYIL